MHNCIIEYLALQDVTSLETILKFSNCSGTLILGQCCNNKQLSWTLRWCRDNIMTPSDRKSIEFQNSKSRWNIGKPLIYVCAVALYKVVTYVICEALKDANTSWQVIPPIRRSCSILETAWSLLAKDRYISNLRYNNKKQSGPC